MSRQGAGNSTLTGQQGKTERLVYPLGPSGFLVREKYSFAAERLTMKSASQALFRRSPAWRLPSGLSPPPDLGRVQPPERPLLRHAWWARPAMLVRARSEAITMLRSIATPKIVLPFG